MTDDHLRAWWAHRQGLDSPLEGATAGTVLDRVGWARSVGGAGPYLALFARAGISRETIDRTVADLEIHELPAARGCTYVVPAADFGIALRVGQGFGDEAQITTAKRYLGVTDAELEALAEAVVDVLRSGPLDPRDLKEALGDRVRNLGAEGKKRGTTTTLPLAIGKLQSTGEIRRIPVNGRIDQQRYRYVLWSGPKPAGLDLPLDQAQTELAQRYFRWIGPATLAHFQWFSGLSGKVAKAAIAPLGLVPLTDGDDRLLFPEDREAYFAFEAPRDSRYTLVAGSDSVTLLRRDIQSMISSADAGAAFMSDRGEWLAAGSALTEASNHLILDRGRLVGLWEYDPEAAEIVWRTFEPQSDALQTVVARTEAFIRDQLGDMRSFSLDSPASRRPKIEALRRSMPAAA